MEFSNAFTAIFVCMRVLRSTRSLVINQTMHNFKRKLLATNSKNVHNKQIRGIAGKQ